MDKELARLVESALKFKRENEQYKEQLGEARRLLRLVNLDDRVDAKLTLTLLRDLIDPVGHS